MIQLPKIIIQFKVKRPKNYTPTILKRSAELAPLLRDLFDSNTFDWTEEMLLICINCRNELMHYCTISTGSMTGTVCDIRKILLIALQTGAISIIIAHNHPSGSLKPSRNDLYITEQLKGAASLHEIKLVDHIILTHDSYYSMMDEGDM